MAEELSETKISGKKFSGKTVYNGITMGKVMVLQKDQEQIRRTRIEDSAHECGRVQGAVDASKQQLAALYDKAVKEVGESSAAIFEVHQMMLEDEDYLDAIYHIIRTEMVNAEYAVAITADNFAAMFAGMEDEYMQARAADVRDISARVVRNLSGQGGVDFSAMEPSIIVADDLSPSETVQMDKKKILAFVTVHGSTNSHTAILARMMNIPALIGVKMDLGAIRTGMTAIVDGAAGEVIFEPTEFQCSEAEKKIQNEREKLRLLQELKGKKNETSDGRTINIYANIGSVSDVGYVLENDSIRQVTVDHSLVQLLVDRGEITPAEARIHPQKNLITRALGVDSEVECDLTWLEPEKGERLLLCSDGLTNEREDFCRALLSLTLERGAPDNVTVVLAQL